jgi:GST-like protein
MYTLFATPGSVGCAAVDAALRLCGVPFETVEAAPWTESPGRDRLKLANPLVQIPTLQGAGGELLTETAAILIHLGLTHPEARLLPTDAAARANHLRGLVYLAANVYPAITVIDFPERFCEACSDDEAKRIRAQTRRHLHGLWEVFADSFTAPPAAAFLAGGEPGALDLMAAALSKCFGTRPHLASARPGFAALLSRIDVHPRFADTEQRYWPSST